MSIFNWLLAGTVVGWATTSLLGTTAREARIFNVALGIPGAAVGFWILGPMLGVGPGLTSLGFIVSAVGAATALTVVHFVRPYVLN